METDLEIIADDFAEDLTNSKYYNKVDIAAKFRAAVILINKKTLHKTEAQKQLMPLQQKSAALRRVNKRYSFERDYWFNIAKIYIGKHLQSYYDDLNGKLKQEKLM